MKNGWILYIIGFVRIRISGSRIELFLNEANRKKIFLWEIRRMDSETLECNIKRTDIWRMRKIRKRTNSSFVFVERYGLPFQLKQLLMNKGFLIGVSSFFVMLFMLSNMVFGIHIKGASPVVEELIRKELDVLGIKEGAFIFQLDDPETIQKKLTNQIAEITWIGVQLNGTTYQFQVVEKEEPVKEKVAPPQHIIASKEAMITKIYSENGRAVVKVNQFVKKGQLLISGFIGKEGEKKQISVPANGVVLGETWYHSHIEVPIKSTFTTLTGNVQKKYYIELGNFQLKIWGFEKKKYKLVEVQEEKKNFYLFKWKIPITFNVKKIYEKNELERQYTLEEAIQVGKESGEKELKKKLPKDAMIKEVKILHQKVSSGKVNISIYFVVEEDITAIKPIQ